jgi:hypothetical protein
MARKEKVLSLGAKCRDTVSGFTGVAIAMTQFMTGCTRWTLQPEVNKEGKLPERETFDEPMIEVLQPAKVELPSGQGPG